MMPSVSTLRSLMFGSGMARPDAPAGKAASRRCAPDKKTAGADRRWLLVVMALFAGIYLVFYPPIYTSIDEASTFRMALAMHHGWFIPHDPEFFPSISPIGIPGRMYRFPIGFPAVLSLASVFGWRAFFLVNPLLHLTAAWCFGRILQSNRISAKYAVLYLLYPCFILFTRTLYSDAFAASLTTTALYLILCRRSPGSAGLCLGLAFAARAASAPVAILLFLSLLLWDQRRGLLSWRRALSLRFLLGVTPFLVCVGAYNIYTMGSPFRSTYSIAQLSLHGLISTGPLYAVSMLIFYPGLLLAPFLYRGVYWKTVLAAATLILLTAASYDESTYGNTALQTLLSTPRQLLPVMPFYLLAYCGLLAKCFPEPFLRRVRAFEVAAVLLLGMTIVISFLHQQYQQRLVAIQTQISQTLPVHSVIYANKDVYKLHQPPWDSRTCRQLPFVTNAQAAEDLKTAPVFVVLFLRSRGFTAEDTENARLLSDLHTRFLLTPMALPEDRGLQVYRVNKVRASIGTRLSTFLP